MERTIFFIVADEKSNPDERDCMKAIAAAISVYGRKEDAYCCLKIDQPVEVGIPKSCHHGPPVDDETYARIARYDDVYMEQAYGEVFLIGVGASTQSVLLRAQSVVEANPNARLVNVTLLPTKLTLERNAQVGLGMVDFGMERGLKMAL